MEVDALARAATQFQKKLQEVKRANQPAGFDWYPYDSFAVFQVLAGMLRKERRDLLSLACASPVLDIGCGDGDLSFFFESNGCRVLALDSQGPNYNQTRGFQALRMALQSSVELQVCDLDAGVHFGGRTFGLALFLGVLYHLKNPYGVLEVLAKHVRYCLLSTRIAQLTAHGTSIEEDPIAYLVDPLEANRDSSNYWIFSEAGLRRILHRTGWEICDFATTGYKSGSTPADQDRDQRAFCMLRSNLPDPWAGAGVDLDGGWHPMENGSWRWTERVFSVRIKGAASATSTLRFQFRLHDSIFNAIGGVRLHAVVNSEALPICEYNSPGEHIYERQLPRGLDLTIRFELDKAFGPTPADRRELGLQVIFWIYDGPAPRPLDPIAVLE
ncbi:MAG: methyltransferase domain-containing protein [Bryobacteraceae bacterium]